MADHPGSHPSLSELRLIQQQLEAQRATQQALFQQPVQTGLLNPGQTLGGLFTDPTQAQSAGLLQTGLGLLSADPRDPVTKQFSSAIQSGLGALNTARDTARTRQLQESQLQIQGLQEQFRGQLDIAQLEATLAPKPAATKQSFFINPNTKETKGLTSIGGILTDDSGQRVTAQQLSEQGFIPFSAQLTGADVVKPPKTGDLKQANLASNVAGIKSQTAVLRRELLGEGENNITRLAKQFGAAVSFPATSTRAISTAKKQITNAKGRIESGGQIRKDEMANYEDFLVPTFADSLTPGLIEAKLAALDLFSDTVLAIVAAPKSDHRAMLAEFDTQMQALLSGDAPSTPEAGAGGGNVVDFSDLPTGTP